MQVVDTSKECVTILSSSLDAQLVVACPTEGSTNHSSAVLLRLTVERYHHLGSVVHSCTNTIMVDNHLQTCRQGLFSHTSLLTPSTMKVSKPSTFLTKGHHAAGILLQLDRLFLTITNHRPGFYHIALIVGFIIKVHEEVVFLIFQGDDGLVSLLSATCHHQLCRHITISMGNTQCCLVETVATKGRISVVIDTHGIVNLMGLFSLQARTIIMNTRRLSLIHGKHQRGFGSIHKHIFGIDNMTHC